MDLDLVRTWMFGPVEIRWHTREGRSSVLGCVNIILARGCQACYCRSGWLVELHSLRTWRWLSIDWTKRPCPCDLAMAEQESESAA